MSNPIVRTIRKRITQALQFEIEFSRVGRSLERAVDTTLNAVPLSSPDRSAHRRARGIVRAGLNAPERGDAESADDSIEQIPLEAPRDFARTARRHATRVIKAGAGLPEIKRGLGRALDSTLDLVPLHSPRRMVRNVRRRAFVVLKANLSPSALRRGLAQMVDETIDQIPLETPKGIAKVVRRKATEVLRTDVGISEIKRGLGRTLNDTLDLVPLHSPRRMARNVHRRAFTVLKGNLRLSLMSRGLTQAVGDTIDQIPLKTPKGIAKIVHRETTKALQTDVGISEIQRGLGRTFRKTMQGMPLDSRLLVGHGPARNKYQNRQLAWSLAFVAGAVNAGGFLAVQAFTSHVTGVVSRAADELVLGHTAIAMVSIGVVVSFFAGAFCAGFLISLGRRYRFQAHYALSLMLEAVLLLVFGFMGSQLHQVKHFYVPATVALLSFVMGMHNSVVTTISNAEVRTTHLTGIVTDMGLEFSRLLYFNVEDEGMKRIVGNRHKLKLHSLILVSFFVGGLAGAVGFQRVGFKMTIFLALFLILLAWRPVLEDIKIRVRLIRQPAAE